MKLIDRYLNAIRFWLPSEQQDDIIAELGDDLRAEVGDRESDLGRPLNEAELSAIIKRRGDPVVVAGSYLELKPLVGPALLPLYWFIVKLVTLWVLIPVFVLIIGPIAMTQSTNIGLAWAETVWNLFMGQVFAFGTITVVFMCLERSKTGMGLLAQSVDNWDPSKLPVLPLEHARQARATPRSVAIAEIVASVVVGLLFLTAMWGPAQIQLNRLIIKPAPIWMIVRWLFLAQFPVSIALGWYTLAQPYAVRLRETVKLAVDAANFVIVVVLLIANEWIILESIQLTPVELASATHWANFGIRIGLGIAAAITGATVIDRARRLLRKPSGGPASLLHTA